MGRRRGDRDGADRRRRVALAHKGFTWHRVEVRGRAAHGSRPEEGVDAIARMGRVLAGIERLSAALAEREPHPLLGPGSIHASLIEGGRELSSYPDRCLFQLERRTFPGETVEDVEAELNAMLDAIAAGAPGFRRAADDARPPADGGRRDEPIVEAAREALGGDGLIGVPFWADSAISPPPASPPSSSAPAAQAPTPTSSGSTWPSSTVRRRARPGDRSSRRG